MVPWLKGVLRMRVLGLLAAGAVTLLAVQSPVLTFYRVSGNSMRPFFEDGDRVLVLTLPGLVGGIGTGDPVIAEHEGEALIKRVMAIPGDAIEICDGTVMLNGIVAADPVPVEYRGHFDFAPTRMHRGEYFVLGDNREISVDSRCLGAIEGHSIVGKVLYRFSSGQAEVVTAAEWR